MTKARFTIRGKLKYHYWGIRESRDGDWCGELAPPRLYRKRLEPPLPHPARAGVMMMRVPAQCGLLETG